jgi:hypothetical protein
VSNRSLALVLSLSGLLLPQAVLAAPLPGFVLTAQTDHFSFYTREREKVDAGRSEKYIVKIEQLLGQQVAAHTDYYRYHSPEEVAVATGRYAAGVTFPKNAQIHSTLEFHAHEIVHLVASQLGDPGSFFQEGLAVAVGNEGTWNGKDVNKLARPAKSLQMAAFVASFDRVDPEIGYPVAGSFVAFLIRTHGIAKVTELFRSCPAQAMPVAFQAAFGQSLDAAGVAWAASL